MYSDAVMKTVESRSMSGMSVEWGSPLNVVTDIKLLDHKPILRAEDRDLLDLLSAHAASAMFAARLFATKDRKLRTLESLVKLARGE